MPDVYKKAKSNRQFMNLSHYSFLSLEIRFFQKIGFLKPRYHSEPEQLEDDWKMSFDYVDGWLEKNRETIL
jgi:hypothetical protein